MNVESAVIGGEAAAAKFLSALERSDKQRRPLLTNHNPLIGGEKV